MRASIRSAFVLVVVATLFLASASGCSRAKPESTPFSPAVKGGTPVGAAYPLETEPAPSPPPFTATVAAPPPSPTPEGLPSPTPSALPPTPTPTTEATVESEAATPSETSSEVRDVTYTVKWGDNLSRLAQNFGTTVEEIARLNNLSNTDFIRVGQVLVISTEAASASEDYSTYVVRAGDSLSVLAARFGTTVEELQRINQIVNPWYIYVGQKLSVPSTSDGSTSSSTTYVVRAGDTLWHVAIRHGTTVWKIRIANNIQNPDVIYPGQELIIP